ASTGLSDGGDEQGLSLVANSRLPGTIPGTVNPPHAPDAKDQQPVVAAAPASVPATATPAPTRVASAASGAQSDGFFSSLAHKMGPGGRPADTTATTPPPAQATASAKSKTGEAKPKAKPAETRQAANPPALKPSISGSQSAFDPSASSSKDAIV